MIAFLKYLKGCYMEEDKEFFSGVSEDNTRSNGAKLQ